MTQNWTLKHTHRRQGFVELFYGWVVYGEAGDGAPGNVDEGGGGGGHWGVQNYEDKNMFMC